MLVNLVLLGLINKYKDVQELLVLFHFGRIDWSTHTTPVGKLNLLGLIVWGCTAIVSVIHFGRIDWSTHTTPFGKLRLTVLGLTA